MNYIFKPTPENFKRVQEKCFDAGFIWVDRNMDKGEIKSGEVIVNNPEINLKVSEASDIFIRHFCFTANKPNVTESEFLELNLKELK